MQNNSGFQFQWAKVAKINFECKMQLGSETNISMNEICKIKFRKRNAKKEIKTEYFDDRNLQKQISKFEMQIMCKFNVNG